MPLTNLFVDKCAFAKSDKFVNFVGRAVDASVVAFGITGSVDVVVFCPKMLGNLNFFA